MCPITKSAKKALRQNLKRKAENLKKKKKTKNALKEIKTSILQKDEKKAEEALSLAYKMLDKEAKIGLIKKNTAARKKSQIAAMANKAFPKK